MSQASKPTTNFSKMLPDEYIKIEQNKITREFADVLEDQKNLKPAYQSKKPWYLE